MARPVCLPPPCHQRLLDVGNPIDRRPLHAIVRVLARLYLHAGVLHNALVLCYGVGVTASAVTDIASLTSIDIVEISKDVVAMSDIIYPAERHPLHDPRVRVRFEDARQFLQMTDRRYDLITGEPPPLLAPGAVNLSRRRYFRLMHDRLEQGGVATCWLPIPGDGTYDVAPVIRAFCDVFEDCSLWNGALFDWMLVGTRHSRGPVTVRQVSNAWDNPRIGPHLREIGFENPQQLGAAFLGDAPY